MSDNKKDNSLQDRLRVDANDPSEVEYLHSQFPHLTHQQVADAVKSAGPMRDDIEKYLDRVK